MRVAQLDRASGYGPEGRGFESCHAHFKDGSQMRTVFLHVFMILYKGPKVQNPNHACLNENFDLM